MDRIANKGTSGAAAAASTEGSKDGLAALPHRNDRERPSKRPRRAAAAATVKPTGKRKSPAKETAAVDGAPTLATTLLHPAPAPSRDEIATATAAASALVVTSGDSSHPNKRSRKPAVAASSASNDAAAAATKVILVAPDPPPPALPLPPSTATAAEPSLQRSSARIRQTRKSVPPDGCSCT